MRFWWVNQGQTFREELAGGYIWSPMKNRDGSRNQTYLNMREVKPGDLVFSYADGTVPAVGIPEKEYVATPKPAAFGKAGERWAASGWLVPMRWIRLSVPLRPRDHLPEIVPLLPPKYSPIRNNGFGNQKFYLTKISDALGSLLTSLIGGSNQFALDLIEDGMQIVEDDREEDKLRLQDVPETQREQLIKARRGQGIFRANVEQIELRCRLTGVTDRRFLVASHIKPWRISSNEERLDGNNGLLLSPHVDKLFDRGWIAFSDSGSILCENRVALDLMKKWGLDPAQNVGIFRRQQRPYLRFHRQNVFRPNDESAFRRHKNSELQ